MQVSRNGYGVTVCTVGSEPWRGSLSDRILIAENRWRRFLRFTRKRLTIFSPPIDGVVLRYGHLYGPGTGTNAAEAPALHVDAAAWAAVLAIEKARRGIYNIAEPSGYLSTEKARRELGFDASVRLNAAA